MQKQCVAGRLPLYRAQPCVRHSSHAKPPADAGSARWGADQQFIAMLDAYRGSGGLARDEEVVSLFSRCGGPSMVTLARWIVNRSVICFEWQSHSWIPLFQFDRDNELHPSASLQPVYSELACVYDPWEMGNWFARPNPWLADLAPVDAMVGGNREAVLDAARADRFAANG